MRKICKTCGTDKPLEAYGVDADKPGGRRASCRECRRKARQRAANAPASPDPAVDAPTGTSKAAAALNASKARLESDFDALQPIDFAVGALNDGNVDPKAAAEKRQEYSRDMGAFMQALARSRATGEAIPARFGAFLANLVEQARRYANRHTARSVSIAAELEALRLAQVAALCAEHLADKITPAGYATLRNPPRLDGDELPITIGAVFSDWHLGSDLDDVDNPIPFGAVQEARRLESITRGVLDARAADRARSELVVLLNGDLIEGRLLHDLRSGAPLAEQAVIFWRYARQMFALFARHFPRVRVFCQPGNHGRDKLRHPGRAHVSRYDGHEWLLYQGLADMCLGLPNVHFEREPDGTLARKPISLVDVHGHTLAVAHGDAEIKLRDPDSGAKENARIFDRVNGGRRPLYGKRLDAFVGGHFHKGRFILGGVDLLFNPALIPPTPHARSEGYVGEPNGQAIFEAERGDGVAISRVKFERVDERTDHDERLGTLITPFRFR
jgi:hypothetical protein